ncbi:MAG: efflux RND transporter periplasmic adaptor subunit [Verrucomicrobia bacterium]|nr:MAG: efflux RND transporter periplasmic adaptor subunit [Verrucomicrobiota bacterium]
MNMDSTKKWNGRVGLTLAALLLVGLGCGKHDSAPHKMVMPVKLTPALKMETPVIISAFGMTEDRESVDIIPQVSGQLVKTFIQDGAVVTNGQPLFLIDPRDYESRVQQAEGAVAADRANSELARLTLERTQPLLAKKLVSQEDFDTLKTKEAAVAAQLKADEAQLALARLNLERCTVTAPLAGVCSKRYVDDGNLVAAGQSRLTNIRSYDPLDIEFSISEEYLLMLRQVMATDPIKLDIIPRGDTNHYTGTLTFLDNAVDQQTGTIRLRGQLPNPKLKLWARQFIEVRIIAGMLHDAVMVPEGAVQFGKQGPYLFVAKPDSTADLRPVKTGVRYNDLLQIVAGVNGDENVVVLGQLMLFPGAPVMDVAKVPPAGAPGGHGAKK